MFYAIHGFLGRPSDWNFLNVPHHPVDLFNTLDNPPENGLQGWARIFNRTISKEGNIVLGYSLGARLALHALVDSPSQWKAAILVSGHCGFDQDADRVRRKERDWIRADQFVQEDWNDLIKRWDDQPLFKHSKGIFHREEAFYSRNVLSSALRNWSMAEQKNLKPLIEKLNMPIFWIVGGDDLDYRKHAETLQFFHPNSRVWIAPNTGHRLPWEITQEFLTEVKSFLQGVHHAGSGSNSMANDQNISRY